MPSTMSLTEIEAELAEIKTAIETTDEADQSRLDDLARRSDAVAEAVKQHRKIGERNA